MPPSNRAVPPHYDARSYYGGRGRQRGRGIDEGRGVRETRDIAAVRTQSRVDTVGSGLEAGRPTWIAGVAWAGSRGISKVEVSLDGGKTWSETILNPPVSPLSWTQWAYRWTPERPGGYRILCRATNGRGEVQDLSPSPPHPSGATGYHAIVARVG